MNRSLQAARRILVVDDHPLVREGIITKLAPHADLQVCGEAETENEALALVKERRPDLALVDISLKEGNGVELVKQLKGRYPQVKVLVLSAAKESLYGERCLRAGALGYVNKQESNSKLVEAVRMVLEGKRYLSPELTKRLLTRALDPAADAKSPTDTLTDRELEVFRHLGEGLTTNAIANKLFLSSHTVDSHRENIKRKLGLENAAELSRAAVEWVLEHQ